MRKAKMNTKDNVPVTTILTRAALIALCSSLVGLLFNLVPPRSIEYIYHPPASVTLSGGEARLADVAEAYDIFQKGAGVFIDARSRDHYKKGHIKGALSLPAYDIDSSLESVLSVLSPEKLVVTYCSGVECDESHKVAEILMQLGYQNIMIFATGFPAWQTAGYPVETGDGRKP